MARPPLTLAALATAAVPGLEVQAARLHTRRSNGAYDAVLLRTAEARHLLIRAPRSQASESEQSADLIALRALTPGIRSRLPFEVPVFVGQAPIDGTRAVVTEFVPGAVRSADELTEPSRLAESVGLAIAAIHALPSGFIADAGLPDRVPRNPAMPWSPSSGAPPTPAGCLPHFSGDGRRPPTMRRSGASGRPS